MPVSVYIIVISFDILSRGFRHARKYFSIYEDNQLEEIQHCMALLAFPPDIRT